jgi:hypothetical protein
LIAFKRIIRSGDYGADVRAVKRALIKAGYGLGIVVTARMGDTAVNRLRTFQQHNHMHVDGVYGIETHRKLSPFFDAYGEHLYNKYVVDTALAKARAMREFCRQFDKGYSYGGEHDGSLADDTPHGYFDCSSSTSFLLYHFGLMVGSQAQVSTFFESYGVAGRGRYLTVHANSDHVWVEFSLPEGYARFDTSPHGDGTHGPRLRSLRRSDLGFVHRHPSGM